MGRKISLFLFGFIWWLFVQNIELGVEAQSYCSGLVALTNISGTIRSHTGPGDYQTNVICEWSIDVSQTGSQNIYFEFTLFDLEYNWDFLVIYDGSNPSAPALSVQTGPNLPPPVTSTGPLAFIVFTSDELITGAGFILNYYGDNCLNRCSGKGFCVSGSCVCNEGWSGADCSIGICSGTPLCNYPDGNCVNNTCICSEGYYGADCAGIYCSGVNTFTTNTGTFTDHHSFGNYLNNQDCTWVITPQDISDSITLNFEMFDTEPNFDFVTVYDGSSVTSGNEIGQFSGSSLPPPVVATSGSMTVRFTSDSSNTYSGFVVTYSTQNCTNHCSGNGNCITGICYCKVGWSGVACDQPTCSYNCWNNGNCINGTTCVCNPQFTGVDCGECNSPSCPISYCSDITTFYAQSGEFSDHYGPGLQASGASCTFVINPLYTNFTSLILTFTYFDISIGTVISIIDANGFTIGIFTGNSHFAPPPIITESKSVIISYTSPSGNVVLGSGFTITYTTVSCLNDCSGAGSCNLDLKCTCLIGYAGSSCEMTYCVNNCSGNGICIQNQCDCNPGLFGVTCLDTHCSGITTYYSPTAVITDHSQGLEYLPNSYCGFVISPTPAGGLSLFFNQFQTETYYDSLSVYGGPNMSSPLIGIYSGSFPPYPIRSVSDSLFILFQSDPAVQYLGFEILYSRNGDCPNSCSSSGWCYNGTCKCFGGKTGIDCSDDFFLPFTEFGQQYSGTLKPWEWTYFSINPMFPMRQFFVNVSLELYTGNPIFYLNVGTFPTEQNYISMANYWGGSIGVKNPTLGTSYYLGIFGSAGINSDYVFTVTADCGTCQNGICNGYVCVCDPCYEGVSCQTLITNCGAQSSSSVGIIIGIIIIVGISIAIIIVVTVTCVKKRQFSFSKSIKSKKSYKEFEDEIISEELK